MTTKEICWNCLSELNKSGDKHMIDGKAKCIIQLYVGTKLNTVVIDRSTVLINRSDVEKYEK